jgi:DNA-3-methyladenine glycosylase II
LDVHGSLELFRRSGDDLIDRWDGERLVRSVPVGDGWVPFVATVRGDLHAPAFDVVVEHAWQVELVRPTVAETFFAAPLGYAGLLREDPILAELNAQFPGVRQIRQLDLFTALIRCISAQQVNLRWAVTTRRRLAEAFGRRHEIAGHVVYGLDPRVIAAADPATIRALQFTTSKSVSIVATAQALVEPGLGVELLEQAPDDEIIDRLISIRGIGRWSAEWVLARTLGRPRVVAGDLGVRKAVGLAYLPTPLPSEQEVRDATAHWGESAGAAQALLLHALGEGALNGKRGLPESRAASRASSPRSGTADASIGMSCRTARHPCGAARRGRGGAARSAKCGY